MENMKSFNRRFLKRNLTGFALLVAALFLVGLLEIIPIRYMSAIIDGLSSNFDVTFLVINLLYWYGLRIGKSIISAVAGWFSSSLSASYSASLRELLFHRIVHTKYETLETASLSDTVTGSIEDINSMGSLLVNPIQYIAQNLFTFLWAIILLIRIDGVLLTACLPLGLLMWFAGQIASKKTAVYQKEKRKLEGGIAARIIGYLLESRDILTFRIQKKALNRFINNSSALEKQQRTAQFISALLTSVLDALWPIATVVVLAMGGYRALNDHLTLGGLVSFMWYVQWAIHPISQMSIYKNQIQVAKVASERMEKLFDVFPVSSDDGPVCNSTIRSMDLQHIFFSHKSTGRGIRDVSLSLLPGIRYSIVGHTGCGKSTLCKLLLGLYIPDSGQITIKTDTGIMENPFYSSKITAAFQEPLVFSGGIASNVAARDVEPDSEKVKQCLNIVGLSSIYDESNDTLSELGDRGLSSGQKQRLAIARILYYNPDVIILDEATSALDSDIESLIMKHLFSNRKSIIIIVAHRLSLAMKTDTCFLMDNGNLIATGSPNELLRTNTTFQKLFRDQIDVQKGSVG